LLVSAGVMISTLSASPTSQASSDRVTTLTTSYLHGIGILSIALVLGGLIGIVQDRTFAAHRQRVAALSLKDSHSTTAGKVETPWKEAMFYLHFLSLPLFVPSLPSLRAQFIALSSSPLRHAPSIPLTGPVQTLLSPLLSKTANPYVHLTSGGIHIAMPTALIALCTNVATQLVCSSGVNRLTSQVSSLTVTLILVVRKATSLILSVYLNGGSGGTQLWVGAALVLLGTVGYTLGSAKPKGKDKEE
jgi:solute carrier family 35 (UDP-xylose/UDP-N-acetylglucosamine transporter), member B4